MKVALVEGRLLYRDHSSAKEVVQPRRLYSRGSSEMEWVVFSLVGSLARYLRGSTVSSPKAA